MIQVRIKRVYEDFSETDGYRVLVDKLWPRGMKKEWLKYDYWAKDITPSPTVRRDIPKIIKFKATNSLRVSCLFCIFKHSPQKTV